MYGGTQVVERILRTHKDRIRIGVDQDDDIGTSVIRLYLVEASDYIDAMLSDTIDSLPVSPSPGALSFAANRWAAYMLHTDLFTANDPSEQSSAVLSWKEMAEKATESYKKNWHSAGKDARWTQQSKSFTEKGVDGVVHGDFDGVVTDDDDIQDKS